MFSFDFVRNKSIEFRVLHKIALNAKRKRIVSVEREFSNMGFGVRDGKILACLVTNKSIDKTAC